MILFNFYTHTPPCVWENPRDKGFHSAKCFRATPSRLLELFKTVCNLNIENTHQMQQETEQNSDFSVLVLERNTFKLRHGHAWRTQTILGKFSPFYRVSFFTCRVNWTEFPISATCLGSHQPHQSLHWCCQRRSMWGPRHTEPPAQAEHHSVPAAGKYCSEGA